MKFPSFQCILLAFSHLVSFGTRLLAKEPTDTLCSVARAIKVLSGMAESGNAYLVEPFLSCPRTTHCKGDPYVWTINQIQPLH